MKPDPQSDQPNNCIVTLSKNVYSKLEQTDAELLDNVFLHNSQIVQERAIHVQEVMERIESED